ncbi:MAG: hypothetical protein Kow00109_09640 [Acidobacteriota bacterium]
MEAAKRPEPWEPSGNPKPRSPERATFPIFIVLWCGPEALMGDSYLLPPNSYLLTPDSATLPDFAGPWLAPRELPCCPLPASALGAFASSR